MFVSVLTASLQCSSPAMPRAMLWPDVASFGFSKKYRNGALLGHLQFFVKQAILLWTFLVSPPAITNSSSGVHINYGNTHFTEKINCFKNTQKFSI